MRKTAILALLCTAVTVTAQQSVRLDMPLTAASLPTATAVSSRRHTMPGSHGWQAANRK